MPAGKRLWRTESGELVEDGHPEALTLAYGEDDEIDAEVDKAPTSKQEQPARNKKSPAPTNKGAA